MRAGVPALMFLSLAFTCYKDQPFIFAYSVQTGIFISDTKLDLSLQEDDRYSGSVIQHWGTGSPPAWEWTYCCSRMLL